MDTGTSNREKKKVYFNSRAIDSLGNVQQKCSPKQRGYLYAGWGTAFATIIDTDVDEKA